MLVFISSCLLSLGVELGKIKAKSEPLDTTIDANISGLVLCHTISYEN